MFEHNFSSRGWRQAKASRSGDLTPHCWWAEEPRASLAAIAWDANSSGAEWAEGGIDRFGHFQPSYSEFFDVLLPQVHWRDLSSRLKHCWKQALDSRLARTDVPWPLYSWLVGWKLLAQQDDCTNEHSSTRKDWGLPSSRVVQYKANEHSRVVPGVEIDWNPEAWEIRAKKVAQSYQIGTTQSGGEINRAIWGRKWPEFTFGG